MLVVTVAVQEATVRADGAYDVERGEVRQGRLGVEEWFCSMSSASFQSGEGLSLVDYDVAVPVFEPGDAVDEGRARSEIKVAFPCSCTDVAKLLCKLRGVVLAARIAVVIVLTESSGDGRIVDETRRRRSFSRRGCRGSNRSRGNTVDRNNRRNRSGGNGSIKMDRKNRTIAVVDCRYGGVIRNGVRDRHLVVSGIALVW